MRSSEYILKHLHTMSLQEVLRKLSDLDGGQIHKVLKSIEGDQTQTWWASDPFSMCIMLFLLGCIVGVTCEKMEQKKRDAEKKKALEETKKKEEVKTCTGTITKEYMDQVSVGDTVKLETEPEESRRQAAKEMEAEETDRAIKQSRLEEHTVVRPKLFHIDTRLSCKSLQDNVMMTNTSRESVAPGDMVILKDEEGWMCLCTAVSSAEHGQIVSLRVGSLEPNT